jgi:death-on-curing protein
MARRPVEYQPELTLLMRFHDVLVEFYSDTENPIFPGLLSESMLRVCIERPFFELRQHTPFPHTLHKATVLLESIINYHPFVDGNKRTALLALYYYLQWNGYEFMIPDDADVFITEIAQGKHNLRAIFTWVNSHSKTKFWTLFRMILLSSNLLSNPSMDFVSVLQFSPRPFRYFLSRLRARAKI